jgi:cold shock CspA family protein/ribosome-associated translation inhibitor RaiA
MMKVPLQVVFEHIAHVDYIEERVRKEAEKLEQFYDHIMSVRAVIARPQHTHHKGDTYSVRLHLTVPGAEDIAVSRDPAVTGRHEDIQVTITDAFDAARRQLQDLVRKRQGHVKAHEIPPHGIIRLLVPERDHGFIASSDGRDIYFHRNSVADGKFDSLEVGQEVRFSEAVGDKGPQATIVRPVGKHHIE